MPQASQEAWSYHLSCKTAIRARCRSSSVKMVSNQARKFKGSEGSMNYAALNQWWPTQVEENRRVNNQTFHAPFMVLNKKYIHLSQKQAECKVNTLSLSLSLSLIFSTWLWVHACSARSSTVFTHRISTSLSLPLLLCSKHYVLKLKRKLWII